MCTVTAQPTTGRIALEPGKRTPAAENFEALLRQKIVGQDEAVSQLVNILEMSVAGMTMPGRPIANLLFLGPTGSGKTRIIEAAAEVLFGNDKAFIKVDCAEFQHSHEIAKLVGSPPGYIGHRETHAILTQAAIDQYQTDAVKMTFVLFDEIEKASDALWLLLLGVLDKGTLTLGDNQRVDMSRTVLVMTSNLGAEAMSRLTGGIGFASPERRTSANQLQKKLDTIAVGAAKRHFSPEFLNRLDKIIVFHALSPAQLQQILDIELAQVQQRVLAIHPQLTFTLECTVEAKQFLIRKGTDARYGARHVKRAIEANLVLPLSRLMSTGQIRAGDIVNVDLATDLDQLVFTKDEAPAAQAPDPEGQEHRMWEYYTAGECNTMQALSV
jgi:ATP-dependent Clp protease ATP-binding subunit ClpB